jgi:hypothetical protein
LHVAKEGSATAFGAHTEFAIDEKFTTKHGGTFVSENERSHSKGFVLEEDGSDYLSVDVLHEPFDEKEENNFKNLISSLIESGDLIEKEVLDLKNINSYSWYQIAEHFKIIDLKYTPTFIFRTKGGATACPYEGEYKTKYFEPERNHIINAATLKKQVPYIDMPNKFIQNVPSGETAKFTLQLRNNAEAKDDPYWFAWYDLKIINSSNPNGARMYIDGAPIGNGLEFMIPVGETIVKTLEVGKGAILNYDNLQLALISQCQKTINDTVTFSVHFTPSCTNVNIKNPSNNWTYNTKLPVMNVNGTDKHYMEVSIDGFNVNYDNFERIALQYKSASQSDNEWITLMNYYNDSILCNKAKENGMNALMINPADAGTIRYNLFLDDMPDQRYDLRAVSFCNINNESVPNSSEIRSGIKDMYNPRLFGSAQPANGILGVTDEIRLNFNEPIAQGLLIRDNFQVRGIRNGAISDHSTSVRFDGINSYMDTEFDKNLKDKNLTVEMWIQPNKLQNATLFSHGNYNESLELSLTNDGCLSVKIGGTTLKSPRLGQTQTNPDYADGSWAHVALVYNVVTNKVTAYYNYSEVISDATVATPYSGIGKFELGRSIATKSSYYDGKIHNVRVWENVINGRNIQLNSLLQLAGIEDGLMAYYPMNEGRGTLCEDKARGATMTQHGTQWAMPEGYAVTTNQGRDYLQIDASSAAFTKEMDFTVEFWFKAEPGQTNATILSAGSGEAGSVKPENGFAISFNAQGKLTFTNNSVSTIVEGEYRDNKWHHYAFSVDRTRGRAQIYVNGNLTNYIDAANVGAIASDYIYLGARAWFNVDKANELVVDNRFKGFVDELRFWDLYRSEKMVNENNNVRLTGDELGLVHYYPFDTYITSSGIKFLAFSGDDMRISRTANPETDKLKVMGDSLAVRTKDIAPIKDCGPVADLDFDFVVNNDALIITLKEQEYKIAKTIVTFTVSDVRDLNGNSLISPITWSAYIDRNQLRWETDRMDISKDVYKPYEFTVKAHNTGGAIRNYTINNVPPWLDVTPSRGTLNPVSYDIVTFSINEGLNVGTYNEVIYLTNEDNVSEPLALNVTVEGEKPDWNVNPANFQYNMSVFGKMRFNNIFSTDKRDMLAAFDNNGKCIGVATSVYNKTFDTWYALLTIYSNDKGPSDVGFRMWEASTGKTYKAEPSQTITFGNDAIKGDVEVPVIFDGKEIFFSNIPLIAGWNWISFNLRAEDPGIDKQLANGSWTKNDQLKDGDSFVSYSEADNKWVGWLPLK